METNNKKQEMKLLETREVFGKELNIYGTAEEPLFLAKDVANWIEHSNVSMMLSKVDEDEKQIIQIGTLNNAYSAWFLTENGLYEVLMQSRKPIAKQFKSEVKKILKEIRMYNYYAKGQTIEEKINNVQAGMIKQNEENFKYIKMLNAKTNSAIYTAEYANNRMMNMENHMQYMIQKTNDYSQYNDSLPYMQRMKFYSINEMIYDLKESANLNISREEIIHTLVFLNLLKYNDLYGYLEPY